MWRKDKAKTTGEPSRPTDEALLEALRLNHDHVRGLTRLDQQIVYVPLGALAAAIYRTTSLAVAPTLTELGRLLFVAALALVGALVGGGLARNHQRHNELMGHRRSLACQLKIPCEPDRRHPLWLGRLIYGLLFGTAWVAGGLVLLSLLTTPQ